MPLFHALLLLASVLVIVVVTQSRRLSPFLAIVFVAAAFGLAAGLTISLIGRAFGTGFSQTIYSPGLTIVVAGFVGALAENTGAAERLGAAIGKLRWLGSTRIAALLGLVAGIGALPAAAFAILTPLLRPISGGAAEKRETISLTLALAISASHGLVLFSPIPIAAASILDADWGRVVLFGLPLAFVLIALSSAWTRWLPVTGVSSNWSAHEAGPISEARRVWPAIVLVLATGIPVLMLIEQSLGDIPSEPLGGGSARELVLGLGRPLAIFIVGVGIAIVGLWQRSAKLLADANWTTRVVGDVATILLIVGAAGGFQRLCQETGMAELFGERVLGFHVAGFGAVLVPFLAAALIKTLQGSSLVAAIAGAGIVQPALAPLGLGDANGKALAALAIGAGAMTASHINDEYFWLVTDRAGVPPLHGLLKFTIGTLLQGLAAVAALLILSAFLSH